MVPLWQTGWDAFLYAVSGGKLPVVDVFLRHGTVDVNAAVENEDGDWRPLTRASYRGHVDIAARLLEHGADPTLTTRVRQAVEVVILLH